MNSSYHIFSDSAESAESADLAESAGSAESAGTAESVYSRIVSCIFLRLLRGRKKTFFFGVQSSCFVHFFAAAIAAAKK